MNSPAAPPTRSWPRWFFGIRWFAGQFAVVVAGILTALALQAAYESRKETAEWRQAIRVVSHDIAADTVVMTTAMARLAGDIAGMETLLDPAARVRLTDDSLVVVFNRTAPFFMRMPFTTAGYERFNRLDPTNTPNESILSLITDYYTRTQAIVIEWDDVARQHSVGRINPYLVEQVPFSVEQLRRQSAARSGALRFSAQTATVLLNDDAFRRLLLRSHYIKASQRHIYGLALIEAREVTDVIERALKG